MDPVLVQQTTQLAVSDFSLWSLFLRADIVVQSVMVGLILASVWCWSIILEKTATLRRVRRQADEFEAVFWSGESLQKIYKQFGAYDGGPSTKVFNTAMGEFVRYENSNKISQGLSLVQFVERALNASVAREMEYLEQRLLVLATVGAVAPFVGLFGTVWGIMNSFQAIAMSQDTNLAVVAPGIAEALFATGLGLLAAIPAVIAYNKFSNDLGRFGARLDRFADDFVALVARQTPREPKA
jgi:biopolymer transport protein TolQ